MASNDVLPEFLFWSLKRLGPEIESKGTGATVKGVTLHNLKELEILLPPLDEQRRIVAILNRAAKIERLRAQAVDRLREFFPALFVRMFGQESLKTSKWPVSSVEQLLQDGGRSIRTGPFGSQLKHSEFTDEGVPVLGIDNVVANRFVWAKPRHVTPSRYSSFSRYRVFPQDVIVTIMGTTGRVCVAPDDLPECMSTKHLCVLTLDRSLIEPYFLWGALLFDESVRTQTRRYGQGQIMEGWNLTIVKGLKIRIPPLRAQRSFAKIVTNAMSVERPACTADECASILTASLMNRLLDRAA